VLLIYIDPGGMGPFRCSLAGYITHTAPELHEATSRGKAGATQQRPCFAVVHLAEHPETVVIAPTRKDILITDSRLF
jgi:hypothetical protein